jgi:L-lactate dehydrogenase
VGQIAKPLARANPEAIFIVVSSPVDLLTLDLIRHGLSSGQVIGTGTLLDTSRLRQKMAKRFGVDPRNVHAVVIGEHGAGRSVPVWSRAMVAGMPLDEYARQAGIPFGPGQRAEVFQQVMSAGEEVIRRKGATFFGVAESVARIVTAISRDERSIVTCSVDLSGYLGVWNLCQSLPVVMGRRGTVRTLWPELDDDEAAAFRATIEPMRQATREMGI